jgi:hypothetical protein
MTLEEEFLKCDLNSIIDRMTLYVQYRTKTLKIKMLEGREPIDFVGEVIKKVLEGKRDWEKANCSFEDFLWGCLKSDLHNFFKKLKLNFDLEDQELADQDVVLTLERREEVIQLLRQEGADDDEILVFECWLDGLLKPKEVAEELGVEVNHINNITKRIKRRLPNINL